MPVAHIVIGVVVVIDEVPSRDVARVAVVVVVDPVAERDDQVLGREHPGRTVTAGCGRRRVRAPRIGFDHVRDSRVTGIGKGFEHAGATHVVRDRAGAARRAARHAAIRVVVTAGARVGRFAVDPCGRVEGFLQVNPRRRPLAGVEQDLAAQPQHVPRVVPFDARVELSDRDVGPAERDLESGPHGSPRGDARPGPGWDRRVGVEEAHAGDAAQLILLGVVVCDSGVPRGIGFLRRGDGGRRRELPPQSADVAGHVAGRERPAGGVGLRTVAEVGEIGSSGRRPRSHSGCDRCDHETPKLSRPPLHEVPFLRRCPRDSLPARAAG